MSNGNYNFKSDHILALGNMVETLKNGEIEQVQLGSGAFFSIVTHSSLIIAELYDINFDGKELNNDNAEQFFISTVHKAVAQDHPDLSSDSPRPIYLKNAKIIPFSSQNTPLKLNFLCIYSDQVLGVSFGREIPNQ